jgi:hypothetical protein
MSSAASPSQTTRSARRARPAGAARQHTHPSEAPRSAGANSAFLRTARLSTARAARLQLRDNDVDSNRLAGLFVTTRACPTVESNRIHHGLDNGIRVTKGAHGVLRDNDVYRNSLAEVHVATKAEPLIDGNTLRDGSPTDPLRNSGGVLQYPAATPKARPLCGPHNVALRASRCAGSVLLLPFRTSRDSVSLPKGGGPVLAPASARPLHQRGRALPRGE